MKRIITWILVPLFVAAGIVVIAYLRWGTPGVGWAGDIGSVLGVTLTLYVARSIWSIEQSYVGQALLPKYVSKLKAHLKNLEIELEAKNAQNVRRKLSLCKTILEGIYNNFPKKTDAGRLTNEIDAMLGRADADLLRNCDRTVDDLHSELERIELLRIEIQWRRRDGD